MAEEQQPQPEDEEFINILYLPDSIAGRVPAWITAWNDNCADYIAHASAWLGEMASEDPEQRAEAIDQVGAAGLMLQGLSHYIEMRLQVEAEYQPKTKGKSRKKVKAPRLAPIPAAPKPPKKAKAPQLAPVPSAAAPEL